MRTFKQIVSYALRHSSIPLRSYTFRLDDGSRFRLHNEVESHSLWMCPPDGDGGPGFARAYLKPGDTFVDIGANIGRYAVPAARVVGPSGHVLALEPTSSTCKALRENMELNCVRNVTVLQMAASATDGTVEFWEYPGTSTLNGMHVRAHRRATAVRVDSLSGRSILERTGKKIDLLKIDTEGLELVIMSSFEEQLSTIPCVIFECSKANYQRAGYTISAMLSFLRSQQRRVYEFAPGRRLAEIDGNNYDVINTELITVTDQRVLTARVGGVFRLDPITRT